MLLAGRQRGELGGGVGQRGLMKCGLVGVEMIIQRQSLFSSFSRKTAAASNKRPIQVVLLQPRMKALFHE